MRARIIFCTAVSLAILAVVLLALFSPAAHKRSRKTQPRPWLALSLYIQPPHSSARPNPHNTVNPDAGAYIFHRTLTEGPHNSSTVIGKAQGFIIPVEKFAYSAFNIIYLTFDMPEYSGSLGIEAKDVTYDGKEKLKVVGGTGSFAFARGHAIFAESDQPASDTEAIYHLKLRLQILNRVRTIPG